MISLQLWKKELNSLDKITSICGIDHIGYAVKEMSEAKEYFKALGFDFSADKIDEYRSVNVSVGTNNQGIRIELLSPVVYKKSPVDTYLRKFGSTPYHICYKTTDINDSVKKLQENGYTLIGSVAPSVPLGGDVCFMYCQEIGMIELIEYGEDR